MLAEGSKMVMVALQSSYNQGVYGLVSNLGSLVVRTIFQVPPEAFMDGCCKVLLKRPAPLLHALHRGLGSSLPFPCMPCSEALLETHSWGGTCVMLPSLSVCVVCMGSRWRRRRSWRSHSRTARTRATRGRASWRWQCGASAS